MNRMTPEVCPGRPDHSVNDQTLAPKLTGGEDFFTRVVFLQRPDGSGQSWRNNSSTARVKALTPVWMAGSGSGA
jgi:hypothetical protein